MDNLHLPREESEERAVLNDIKMDKLYLSTEKSEEENILSIVNFVREIEKKRGLTDEEIDYKYTHGFCSKLAQIVKDTMKEVLDVKISSKSFEELSTPQNPFTHVYLTPKRNKSETPNQSMSLSEAMANKKYIDICGVKKRADVLEFMNSDYMKNKDEKLEEKINREIEDESIVKIQELCFQNIQLNPNEKEVNNNQVEQTNNIDSQNNAQTIITKEELEANSLEYNIANHPEEIIKASQKLAEQEPSFCGKMLGEIKGSVSNICEFVNSHSKSTKPQEITQNERGMWK